MTEALEKKKRSRAGHKACATRTCWQIKGIAAADAPDLSRLALLWLTLKEKLDTIKTLDAEIVDLIGDETELTRELEQADTYRETLFSALIKMDELLEARPSCFPVARSPRWACPQLLLPPGLTLWGFPSFRWDVSMEIWLSGWDSGSRLRRLSTVMMTCQLII